LAAKSASSSALERLAAVSGGSFRSQPRLHGQLAECDGGPGRMRLLMPQTFMNESGRSIRAALDWYRLQPSQLLVGRGLVPQRDRDGFVQIQLEPGWQLQRRVYGQQTLSHVYFANSSPLARLLGEGRGDVSGLTGLAPLPQQPQPLLRERTPSRQPQGPIALQVIPYRP